MSKKLGLEGRTHSSPMIRPSNSPRRTGRRLGCKVAERNRATICTRGKVFMQPKMPASAVEGSAIRRTSGKHHLIHLSSIDGTDAPKNLWFRPAQKTAISPTKQDV